jgi:hypothetical protein
MPATAYGTMADFALYMKDVNQPANAEIASLLLSSVSRWVDNQMGQYFYSDGVSTKYFDGGGEASIETGQHRFYGKIGTIGAVSAGATSLTFTALRGPAPVQGDVLILDVAGTQETVTINGAVTGSSPGEAIDIARIPISGTQFLPSTIPGYMTIAVTASWGWPVVPDPIKDFTVRWAVKMWRSRASGWAESIGNPETGVVHEFLRLNAMDEATVLAHDYKQWAF